MSNLYSSERGNFNNTKTNLKIHPEIINSIQKFGNTFTSVVEEIELNTNYEKILDDDTLKISNKYFDKILTEEELAQMQKEYTKILNDYQKPNERTAALAKWLATFKKKLPYFWGGYHECKLKELKGINLGFGKSDIIKASGSDDQPVGSTCPKSMDCSAFVTWALVNGGFNVSEYTATCFFASDFNNPSSSFGTKYNITDKDLFSANKIKVGDIGWQDGHVGIVVDIDKKKKEITFAHCSGSGGGMNLTTQRTEEVKDENGNMVKKSVIVKDDYGTTKKNTGEEIELRIGKEYFTNIISLNYN